MTPPTKNNITESDQQDKGFETPEFMDSWSDNDKADFVYQMLTTLPPYLVFKIVDRISPYLNRNILSQFPYEIGLHILGFLDIHSIIQASQVCRGWHTLCEEPVLWKNLFESKGWGVDREEMTTYLLNTPTEEDYHAGSSSNGISSGSGNGSGSGSGGGSRSGNGNENGGTSRPISSVPISRTSPPIIGKSKWSKIYRLRNNTNSNKPPSIKPNLIKSELEEYHYDPITDTRFINWQRLYRNRYIIENRWNVGSCRTRKFPELSTENNDLHGEGIYCIQFDKQIVVTGSRDRTIKVWDMVTGKCKQTLRGHEGSVLCLQYDDKFIISGSSDSKILVSDMESGVIKKTLTGHHDSVLSLRLMKDDLFVSCSKDRTLRIWNRDTGECLKVLGGHRAAVNAVQWKDNRIVSASGDRTIKIWDATTGLVLKTLSAHTRGVACVEFDGNYVISGSSDQTIKVWDANTGDCIYTLVGHTDLVRTIQLDSTSNKMISGCYNGHLKTWDIKHGQLIRDLGQATSGSRILNLKFDFSKIICCSNDTRLIIYDFAHDINTKFLV